MDALPVSETLHADALLEGGDSPLALAMRWLRNAPESGILCIESTFEPAPLVDAVGRKGAQVHLEIPGPGQFRLYIHAPT
jgi:hypothetical protein